VLHGAFFVGGEKFFPGDPHTSLFNAKDGISFIIMYICSVFILRLSFQKNMESYSLLELNQCIRMQLKRGMPELYWVVAEINELQVNSAGHCFMELIEKSPHNGQITAKARATIWAYHNKMLAPYFETVTGQRLSAGLKIMLQVSVEFHELYGLSLSVTDINPAFTIGELAMQRQAIIKQLKDEGVYDMNRELEVPFMPQRIAVISSETAAGYGDFVDQLNNNPDGFVFEHTLFKAIVQGNEAEASIISAFEQIFEREDEFDLVVLIRGGGSQSDLNCFNSYQIATCIAQFPLPVITGIGHDRDETVADMVACIALKTPTAVAGFLLEKAAYLNRLLQELSYKLMDVAGITISKHEYKLNHLSQRLQTITYSQVGKHDRELFGLKVRLKNSVHVALLQRKQTLNAMQTQIDKLAVSTIVNNKKHLAHLEEKLHLLDPVNLLRRGYSITFTDGKVVRNADSLKKGQLIKTVLHDGEIESTVN
jgi:exodeoxyribonuclease VII large subunit